MHTRQRINWRILCFACILILLFSGLISRLWWIQSVEAAKIMDKAKNQWHRERMLMPKRGSILDRNNQVLAYEGKAYMVEAQMRPTHDKDKNFVQDPLMTAQKLAPLLDVPVEKLVSKMTKASGPWVELGKITEEPKEAIEALRFPIMSNGQEADQNQLPGIHLRETTQRFYPNNAFATHVIGYMTKDNQAQMGIEKLFDEQLSGERGEMQIIRDAAGFQLPDGEQKYKPAKDGLHVVLTIDQQIQAYVEQALDKIQEKSNPKKMSVIVADPNTGEILAMGNRPQFNPNEYYKGIDNYLNHSISTIFEPGSTFKIITLAAAIQEGQYSSTDRYMSGRIQVPGGWIRDHNNGAGWGEITYLEGVQRSSNVAFVKLGYERLQPKKLVHYFTRFGFGKKTGIELPGEVDAQLPDLLNPRSPRDTAVTTFGQGVAVTAIQQVMSVAAIANGGELLRPRIIKELRDSRSGEVVKSYDKEVVRRVVSESTAKQTNDILESVITSEYGTGKSFAIEGYSVAGKTGTAQKYDEKTGKIMAGHYIVSFIGYAPKDNPRLLVYVVVDDPEYQGDSGVLGSEVVAPIFTFVMEKSLQYLHQQPDITAATKEVIVPVGERTMPDLVNMEAVAAKEKATAGGFVIRIIGSGEKVVKQYPEAKTRVFPGSTITLVTDGAEEVLMPDFTNKSIREVMEFASLANIKVVPTGNGYVKGQSIPPDMVVTGEEVLRVILGPAAAPAVDMDADRVEEPLVDTDPDADSNTGSNRDRASDNGMESDSEASKGEGSS